MKAKQKGKTAVESQRFFLFCEVEENVAETENSCHYFPNILICG
jgi:hypothetical protein